MIKLCKYHGETAHFQEKIGTWRCRRCNAENVSRRRIALKKKSVELLGGKCTICGYNKSISALEFHHKDPQKKEIAFGGGNCYNWSRLEKELQKCILVCANCHREIHEEENKKRNPRIYEERPKKEKVLVETLCALCGKKFKKKSKKQKFCSFMCSRLSVRKAKRPSKEYIIEKYKNKKLKEVAQKYNVNIRTVYNWAYEAVGKKRAFW